MPFLFWDALSCGQPVPACQRTGAWSHSCWLHKITWCGVLCFAYALRAPEANLQPQQDWKTGHDVGLENHPRSSWFPLLISWVVSWKCSFLLDLIYASHLCFSTVHKSRAFFFPCQSSFFLMRKARKMTKVKKKPPQMPSKHIQDRGS